MNALPHPVDISSLPTDDDRELLRTSIRRCLLQAWPAENAVELAREPAAVDRIWTELAELGIGALGRDPVIGGLRELIVAMEELGRAACPAPLAGAALANLALSAHADDAAAELLSGLETGKVRVGYGFGGHDGDPNAGKLSHADCHVDGEVAFVEGAVDATHLLVVLEGPALAIVAANAAGLSITTTEGLSVPPLARAVFRGVPATIIPVAASQVEDWNLMLRLLLQARALGAAARGLDLAVDYAKERQQFGQPIGRFQAIQHKLADTLINVEGSRATLLNAAESYDHGNPLWRAYGLASFAFASPALRQATLEVHHVFAGIGYAEEHEAPRHFRRAHGDLVRLGGAPRARAQLARHLLDKGHSLPDHDLGVAGNAFRKEVRDWLQQHWVEDAALREKALPFEQRHLNFKDARYAAALAETGWAAASWPKAHGGQARTPMEQLALMEELQRVDAPLVSAGDIQAFALMEFGTEKQKAELLPRIRKGEIWFALGYSEPGAGSDLASLKTTAVRDGDAWLINGQKIWTTGAERADYLWLAARTDPQARPAHAGISVFIVPMDTPGITVRPSMAMYGHTFCQEFLDNVRVPLDALVGPLNGGWKVLTCALAHERIIMGGNVASLRRRFEQLVDNVRRLEDAEGQPLKNDRAVRERIGTLAAEIEVARQLLVNSIRMTERGLIPVHEAAMSKVFTSELMERLGEAALDIIGASASLAEGAAGAIAEGRLEQLLRHSIMYVVGGGTAQIQRNLIAQRGLQLPR